MPSTRAEGIFDELKRLLNPGRIWQKVLVLQHEFLKSFSAPTTKLNTAQIIFVPFLQLLNIFRTPDIEQKKPQRVLQFFLILFKNDILKYQNNIKWSTFLIAVKQH